MAIIQGQIIQRIMVGTQKNEDIYKVQRLCYACDCSNEGFRRGLLYADEKGLTAKDVMMTEFRERFAQAVAKRILEDWDKIIINELHEVREGGIIHNEAQLFIGIKEED